MLIHFFKIFIYPLSILPLWLIRISLFPVYLFLAHLISYRKTVVLKNLKIAFPDENEAFYKAQLAMFYRHFYCLICEGLKSFTISKKEILKRFEIEAKLINRYAKKRQDIILMFGHYGNWEWSSLASPHVCKHQMTAIYQPLKNKKINDWVKSNRNRFGTTLISTKEVNEYYKHITKPTAVTYIADQSPSKKGKGVWVDFFGRKTLFLAGAAAKAIEFNHPIFYVYIKRVKLGYYTCHAEEMITHPKDYTLEQIIQKYASKLEEDIKNEPSMYLWSHNRWKHSYYKM